MVWEDYEVCEFCENNIRAHEVDCCEECTERMEREEPLKCNKLVIELNDNELKDLKEFTNRTVKAFEELFEEVLDKLLKDLKDYNNKK